MSYEHFVDTSSELTGLDVARVSREREFEKLRSSSLYDLVVIGGGIHGAALARLAALNGLRTILFEARDYAFGTSSRSSSMLHGGLRYLEFGDIRQVAEGVRAREEVFSSAEHIAKPYRFFIPVGKGNIFERAKYFTGLSLYSLFAGRRARPFSWKKSSDLPELPADLGREIAGGFLFYDGLMNDCRLVQENIIAARQEGALCFNHCPVTSYKQMQNGGFEIGYREAFSGEAGVVYAGALVNCAGPWVARAGRVRPTDFAHRLVFSRGTHLVFSKPWTGPALLLPLPEKSRYYFVWPHFAGTLVGTTEVHVEQPHDDPQPSPEEMMLLLSCLKKDIPQAGLHEENLSYAYAGVRTLVGKTQECSTALLSRRPRWEFHHGVLHLLGGKFTTAHLCVEEGLKKLFSAGGVKTRFARVGKRPLPGASFAEEIMRFRKCAEDSGVSPATIERAVGRWGGRVRFLFDMDEAFEELPGELLRGEVELAVETEQVETLEDLMRRRLQLEYFADRGRDNLDVICTLLQQARPKLDVLAERKKYDQRMKDLETLLASVRA